MIKCVIAKGCPASGKSFWAKAEVAKDPTNWLRINNDDIRAMTNGSVFSTDYEKLVTDTRNFLIREGFKRNLNIIIDNVNSNNRHWETVCKIAKEMNKDIQVLEKHFYIELEEALERNSKREGAARVPDEAVKKFWKELGGKQFKFASPRIEIFTKRDKTLDCNVELMKQDESLPCAIICDLDGSYAIIGDRSPYDASRCDIVDKPNSYVVEAIKLYYDAGYKIIFCSGREDKDKEPTVRFIEKYSPNMTYELFMRKTGDQRSDDIIKEEIFNNNIKDKFYVKAVYDDRLKVCRQWFKMGLNLFRIGDPDASF